MQSHPDKFHTAHTVLETWENIPPVVKSATTVTKQICQVFGKDEE